MKKIIITLSIIFALSVSNAFATPWDIELHNSKDAINTLLEHNATKTYSDGRYKPDRYLSKEDACETFAKIILDSTNGKNIINETKNVDFNYTDVKPYMNSYLPIKYLFSNGLIKNTGEHFNPKANVSREEIAYMVYGYLKSQGAEFGTPVNYNDISDSYAKDAIMAISSIGLMGAEEKNLFNPKGTIKRGDAMIIFQKVSSYELIPLKRTSPDYNVISVPYISQLKPVYAVVGCEGTSLLMGLKGKGYAKDVSLKTFLDNMPKHSSNPAKGFVGSPYVADKTKKTRTTIYPPILTKYAKQYGDVIDFSGSSVTEIKEELLHGNPVLIYATMRWEKPFYRYYNIEGTKQRLLSNNHIVLLTGYDAKANKYYVADPYNINNTSKEYRYWIDATKADNIYNERRQSIVVQ